MSDTITDPEDLIKLIVDSNPDSVVNVLWTELQAERENSKYWEGRTNASRSRLTDERTEHEAEIIRLKEELANAKAAVSVPKITLSSLDRAERADRNNKIDAIKTFRNDTGLGIKESKEAVEWVWDHTKIQPMTPQIIEHIAKYADIRTEDGQASIYRGLVANRYFSNVQDAEMFCLEVWKLLG